MSLSDQELIAQGVANMLVPLFGGIAAALALQYLFVNSLYQTALAKLFGEWQLA